MDIKLTDKDYKYIIISLMETRSKKDNWIYEESFEKDISELITKVKRLREINLSNNKED